MSSRNLVITTNATDPFLIYQQISDSGSAGLIWNKTSLSWEANPSTNDRKVTATAVPGITGAAVAGTAQLGTYTGFVAKWFMDGTAAVGADLVYLVNGVEQRFANSSAETDAATASTNSATLVSRLTNARAGYLDNLSAGAVMLASSYVAPNNSAISAGAADAASAKVAAESTNSRLTATRAGYLDNLSGGAVMLASAYVAPNNSGITNAAADAVIIKADTAALVTRITAMRAGYFDNLSGGPVMLAASYTAPNNAGITTAATESLNASVAAQAVSARLTNARAGYLDNLSAGAVATASQVTVLQNAVNSELSGPADVQKPSVGTTVVPVTLFIFSSSGTLVDPDANNATIAVANSGGTDRSGNLASTTMTRVAQGQYRADYNVASNHANELLVFTVTYLKSAATVKAVRTMSVTSIVADSFTTGDRTKLDAIHAKLPSRSYFVATDASDGDPNVNNFDGDKTTFGATSTITNAITAAQTAVITQGNAAWITATGFVLTGDARLNNLDAAVSTRASAATLAAVKSNTDLVTATPASVADVPSAATIATQVNSTLSAAHGAGSWATATGFLTSDDARLNNLDASIATETAAIDSALAAISAKTTNLPATPASVSDVPSAATIATQVNTTLTSSHGSGAWTTGTATLAKQDAILAAIAGVGGFTPLSVTIVSPQRTWRLSSSREASISPQVITIRKNESVTLAMDFSSWINDGTALSTVGSVTEASGAFAPTSPVIDQSRRKAHASLNVSVPGDYQLLFNVTTTDGQTLIGSGHLTVID